MHTVHYMFVEAEDAGMARNIIESFLDESEGTWFDWYEVGGRWDGSVVPDNVLCYADNQAKWHEVVQTVIEMRNDSVRASREAIVEFGHDFDFPNEYDPRNTDLMLGYYITRMGQIIGEIWCPDSHAFDVSTHSAALTYQEERCDVRPDNQFLVVVDFHF